MSLDITQKGVAEALCFSLAYSVFIVGIIAIMIQENKPKKED